MTEGLRSAITTVIGTVATILATAAANKLLDSKPVKKVIETASAKKC